MNQNELTEGEDYYIDEDGLIVFTEKYHLQKGDCCGMGCLHCPYDYKNVTETPKPPKGGLEDSSLK